MSKEIKDFLEGVALIEAAHDMAESDPEIMSGTIVVKGTRVPVHDVAASIKKGISMERILEAYPRITKEQAELCYVYVYGQKPEEK